MHRKIIERMALRLDSLSVFVWKKYGCYDMIGDVKGRSVAQGKITMY